MAEANSDVTAWYIFGANGEKLYSLHWDTSYGFSADVYATDHLGSIRQVVKPNGETANWYTYDPFGQITWQYHSLDSIYRFASAPIDATYSSNISAYSSFYNLRARLYAPGTGRFLTQDMEEPVEGSRRVRPIRYVQVFGTM